MEVAIQISVNWPKVTRGRAERPDHRKCRQFPRIAEQRQHAKGFSE
jgi:hypothetical protein